MSLERNTISIVVTSVSPCGKKEVIDTLEQLLSAGYPDATINTPIVFEDQASLVEGQLHFELLEGKSMPGAGTRLCDQGGVHIDVASQQKSEISHLLTLFMNQLKDPRFQAAKVECPIHNGLVTIASNPIGMEERYTVHYQVGNLVLDWESSILDHAMDIFRHYITHPHAPQQTWTWVKTMDVPRDTPNYLRYMTQAGSVELVQEASGMADKDYIYRVKFKAPDQPDNKAYPTTTGSFTIAADYFLSCARSL